MRKRAPAIVLLFTALAFSVTVFVLNCKAPEPEQGEGQDKSAGGAGAGDPLAREGIPPQPPAAANEEGEGESSEQEYLTIATWNVRGYPEKTAEARAWFTQTLRKLGAQVLCIQEIANQEKVNAFLDAEKTYTQVAFTDSSDGQDNAIFCSAAVGVRDLPDPQGFQHPAQAAYVWYKGFDAVVITVHLSWSDEALREKEKVLLKGVVTESLKVDPDVLICGDFNTREAGIEDLAQAIGMHVMVPEGQEGVGTTHAGNRYDHFLVSSDLKDEEAASCRIVQFAGEEEAREVSDHIVVLALFKFNIYYKD